MTQELAASTIAHGKSRVQRHKHSRNFQAMLERAIRSISKGVLAGAILASAHSLAHAQAPVLREGSDGRPVMRINAQPVESPAPQTTRSPILQPIQRTPQLQQISPPTTANYPQFQAPPNYSAQPAFNIASPQQAPNVQLVAERRGFLDVLMPWRRRNNVPQEYEQPIEPPNQYNASNPLPANAATEFGPAMSGFNQRTTRPSTQPPTAPPRTAQATPINPPIVRTPPATPPQAAGTATTNDGRELPVFQFGTGPARPATTLTPPRAPGVDSNASPVITSPATEPRPNVTPANPAPPIMPLRSPSSGSPPISESSSSQQIDPPAFVDPIVRPEAPAASPFPAPSNDPLPQSESAATAFPPPPSGGSASPPVLAAPTIQQDSPPAFIPPGAPRMEPTEQPALTTPAPAPQLSAVPPALTPPSASFAVIDDQQSEESSEDKFARIHERRGQTGLKGFCPVMLRDQRELVDARPEFAIEFNGETYFVSSAEALATFTADPVKYAPAAAGSDIIHRDLTGEDLPGSLDHAVWYRGRLYMFATAETLETFVAAPAAHRTDL